MLQKSLLPLFRLVDATMPVTALNFHIQKCVIRCANSKTLLQAPKLHGLYHLDNELVKNQTYQSLTAFDVHKKLGHTYILQSPKTFVEPQYDSRHRAQLHWRQDHLRCMYQVEDNTQVSP